jgi:tRNA pseudouridine55 synthase
MRKNFGLLIVDKPIGPTSHHVVNLVRRGTGIRKVGHAGTLDPRASGVLVLCLGSATRLSEYLSTSAKRYEAVVRFGMSTKTFDSDGEIVRQTDKSPTIQEIQGILPRFRGEIQQTPPPFSAIKIQGQKAYELARRGEDVELEPRTVHIFELKVVSYEPPDLSVSVDCSAGTYIRSLAHELGEALEAGAHLAALRRTRAGPFSLRDAVPLPRLEVGFVTDKWEQHMRPASDALPDLPVVEVEGETLDLIRNGHRIPAEPGATGAAKAIGPDGDLVALLEVVNGDSEYQPRKVFIG